jgi:hypothetical protein
VGTFVNVTLPQMLSESGSFDRIAGIFTAIGALRSLVHAVAMGMFGWAIFGWRLL